MLASGVLASSPNSDNVMLATLNGLQSISSPETIAAKRGKTVEQIVGTE